MKSKKKAQFSMDGAVFGKERSHKIFYWCLLALPLLHFCVFYIGVNFNSILLAFKTYTMKDNVWRATYNLANFKRVFELLRFDTVMQINLKNSFTFYLFGLVVTLPFSLIFSFYIYKKHFASEFFRVILFLPGMISVVVTAFMFKGVVNNGVPEILREHGKDIIAPLQDVEMRMSMVILYSFLMGFGTNILMYSNAMTRIDVSVVEAAMLDGVKPMREFFSISLPLIFDTISTFLVIGIAGFFTNQASLHALYGINAMEYREVRTLGYQMFVETQIAENREATYPYLAALGLCCTMVAFPLTMFVRWALDKVNPNSQA
jgi:ABC-type sugar transport system permease subunit